MSLDAQPKIRIKPFLKGELSHGRTVIRTLTEPHYLSVSKQELQVIEQMVGLDIAIETYVKWHLAGQEGLTFREAVSLISRLNENQFLEDHRAEEAMPRIEEVYLKVPTRFYLAMRWLKNALSSAFDFPLFSFPVGAPSPQVRAIGSGLVSVPAFLMLSLLCLYFLPTFSSISTYGLSAWKGLLKTPEVLLGQFFLAIITCTNFLSLIKAVMLAGSKVDFMPCELRLHLFLLPHFSIKDDDVILLPKSKIARYCINQITVPWIFGGIFWQLSGPIFFQILAFTFLVTGIIRLSPLYQGPIIRLAEGLLGMCQVLKVANHYLHSRLLKNIWKKEDPSLKSQLGSGKSFEYFLGFFTCGSLVWLYVNTLLFSDALTLSLPGLWQHLALGPISLRAWSAITILFALSSIFALVSSKFFLVVAENLISIAELPARKARQGIESFYRTYAAPSEALTAFFNDIPIFAHLSEHQIMLLTQRVVQKNYRKGQIIIKQGESGDAFYVVGSGEAQVIVEHPNGWKELVGVLKPGDSFGEVSLIDNTPRNATVRAGEDMKMFELGKDDFASLYPEDSSERNQLTHLIRRVKLILDSQALSHLSPNQIRELLRCATLEEFAPGQTLVTSGDIGDAAYLIESGKAKVCLSGNQMPAAFLQKGDLVGIISLIKGIKRTADVVAETHVTALKIDRAIFLRVCMSDVFVAMLMADLSDKQLGGQKAA